MLSRQELEAISDTTKKIFRRLRRISPPDPNASPGTKNAFRTALTTIAQVAGQTLATAVGLGHLVLEETGNPPNLGLTAQEWHDIGPGSDEETCRDEVKQELERIFVDTDDDGGHFFHYTTEDYFRMVLNRGHPGKMVEEDREAYRRLLVGYEKSSMFEISACFDRFCVNRSSVSRVAGQAIKIGKIEDLTVRLETREAFIFQGSSEDSIALYLLTVIRNIEGYQAFTFWKEQTSNFKNAFIQKFARSQSPEEFDRIDALAISEKDKKKKITQLVTPVFTKHSKMMEQRERFGELYLRFGPIVLLDLTFMKMDEKDFPRFSTFSLAVFKAVAQKVRHENRGQIKYGDDFRFVVRVLTVLGGDKVGEYVEDFLNRNCYWEWDKEVV